MSHWYCPECDYKNSDASKTCSVCGADRPDTEPKPVEYKEVELSTDEEPVAVAPLEGNDNCINCNGVKEIVKSNIRLFKTNTKCFRLGQLSQSMLRMLMHFQRRCL